MKAQEEISPQNAIQLLLKEILHQEKIAEIMQEIVIMYAKKTSMRGNMKTLEIDTDLKMITEEQDVTQEIEKAVIAETEVIG